VLQEYIKKKGLKVAVIFEGRDAAGKGGAISRITEAMSPRVCRVCALGTPTDKERSQWYFQRYVEHLPSGGEMVLFDRSWYNRAGVELVMGFCTDAEYEEFCRTVPVFEDMLGKAVQVDPIKPTLKAPGTKPLKLNHYESPSNVAFQYNLRRYSSCRAAPS